MLRRDAKSPKSDGEHEVIKSATAAVASSSGNKVEIGADNDEDADDDDDDDVTDRSRSVTTIVDESKEPGISTADFLEFISAPAAAEAEVFVGKRDKSSSLVLSSIEEALMKEFESGDEDDAAIVGSFLSSLKASGGEVVNSKDRGLLFS